MRGGSHGNYRNPCLTAHQPWASLLVYGIKRIEGRTWPAPIRGRLWIHAAGKVPDPAAIKAIEDFYREIYAVNGITDIKFPEHYPASRLLGCVEVVGCVKREELVCWEQLPEGVRLEGKTDFCWLCEHPEKLVVPFEMRGFQGVYNLEKKIYEAAVRGLRSVDGPQPVKFPLPDPRDPFSLKPGSLTASFVGSKATVDKTPNLTAATQFSKEKKKYEASMVQKDASECTTSQSEDKIIKEGRSVSGDEISNEESSANTYRQRIRNMDRRGNSSN
ncbi:activating signal cointegrator 1-like [Macadamia integrifolia]|uniref:activating signal cointegrator 1-like n=1 Tax=Macadamia integrifolia TaxID=60698 RepID=UPI001C500CD5|nr:activating signal cointegrator 1-like [Macadamia integrifolia]